jgi:hypothetical protein
MWLGMLQYRDYITSSPFPKDGFPPTDIIVGYVEDHKNVEEIQQLELPVNAKFHHSDNSMKSMEEKNREDIIYISSQ